MISKLKEAVTRNAFEHMRPTHSIISNVITEAIGVNVIGAAKTKPKSIGRSWPFFIIKNAREPGRMENSHGRLNLSRVSECGLFY